MSETLGWFAFEELSGRLVHDMLQLRQDVFVVEQACAFADIDGLDLEAEHLLAFRDGSLAGCLRLFSGAEMRIGRIATASSARGTGLGHRLMAAALDRCRTSRPDAAIILSAQAHLTDFYAGHGFIVASPAYLEDGIAHVDMRRPSS